MTRRGLLGRLDNGEQFLVDSDRFTIGRAASCDLCMATGTLSRRHSMIVRRPEGWFLEDLHSTSGTFIDHARIIGPHPLAAGERITYGGNESIKIVDLDYIASPGEFTPPLRRTLRFECSVVCRILLDVTSRTGKAALDRAFAELLATAPGTIEGDVVHCTDPIAMVLAVRDIDTALQNQLAGVQIRARTHDIWVGATAVELLREASEPARVAWSWLARTDRLPKVRVGALLAAAMDAGDTVEATPAALLTEVGSEPGLLLWIAGFGCGWLIRIDSAATMGQGDGVDISLGNWPGLGRATFVTRGGRWFVDVVPEWYRVPAYTGLELRTGSKLDLGRLTFEVIAIRRTAST